MRVLFLFQTFSFKSSTIYLDLLREMQERGHKVTVIAGTTDPDCSGGIQEIEGMEVLFLRLPNQFGAGKLKKGLIQLLIGPMMKSLIRWELWNRKFDVVAYPTPPVTLAPVVEKCHKRYRCITYLMLKDIFPQNAVDLGMMKEGGMTHRYFRKLEKRLYAASDRIGCMSEANVEYIRTHESDVPVKKLEYFPNTVKLKEFHPAAGKNDGKVHLMFGGNMGKPQAVDRLLSGIRKAADIPELSVLHFFFVGDGSESGAIEEFASKTDPEFFTYRHSCPREEYEELLSQCDAGIVSLAPEFTIPNYPSRILSYMQVGKPVLAFTDRNTDIRELVTEEGRFGFWAPSDDEEAFIKILREVVQRKAELPEMGLRGRRYLERYFHTGVSAEILERAYRG